MMTDAFHRLPVSFNIKKLQSDLELITHNLWLQHVNTGAHDGGWDNLPLRSVDGKTDNGAVVEINPERYKSTKYLTQCSYFQDVLAHFQCQIVSARLMRLKAGSSIARHNDHDLCFEDGCARLHIPIRTHQDVIFQINDEPVHFSEGECWYMNANYFHQVENNSNTDRVHLVIDCVVNKWLQTLFFKSGYETKIIEYKYGSAGITDENVLQVIEQLMHFNTPTAKEMAQNLRAKWHQNKESE